MSIEDAIAKAVEQTKPDPAQGQTGEESKTSSNESVNENQPEQTENQQNAESSVENKESEKKADENVVWDGDINKLPATLQEQAKRVQRYTKQREAEAAEYRKKLQEYESKYSPEALKEFEQWKLQASQRQQQAQEPTTDQIISAEDWEEALLDTSGKKVNALLAGAIEKKVKAAEERYSQTFQQINQERNIAKSEAELNEFINVHPEFVEYHNAGIMKPVLSQVLSQGGTLQDAFDQATKIAKFFDDKALTKSQGRINEKKDAVVIGKTPPAKGDVIWVDTAEEAMDARIGAAMEKKNVTIKIRPKK